METTPRTLVPTGPQTIHSIPPGVIIRRWIGVMAISDWLTSNHVHGLLDFNSCCLAYVVLADGLAGVLTANALLGTIWYGPVYGTAQSIVPPHMRATTAAILRRRMSRDERIEPR
jgi:hypothetical protein